MIRNASAFFILALAVIGFLAAEKKAPSSTADPALSRLVAEPLPSGAVAQNAPSFYGPDNLYQYMDGAADVFVLYGVRSLMHLDARAKGVDLAIDIFDMGTPAAAFGMYAAERASDYHFIAIGAEGYQNTGILNFFQDRYYVKLAAFGEGADAVLDAWSRALSARIGTSLELPPLLSRLPVENRRPHSEQYMPNDPLGHSFLGPAYVVTYAAGDRESKLLVTVARDESDARGRLRQFQEHFERTGQCAAAPDAGPGAIRGANSFEGVVIARTAGRYLLVLLNPIPENGHILDSAAKALQP